MKLLIDDLKLVAQSGVRIRILTGNYLNITQPQALYLVKDALGELRKCREDGLDKGLVVAATGNYSNILEYFTPKRLDNKDVFSL